MQGAVQNIQQQGVPNVNNMDHCYHLISIDVFLIKSIIYTD